MSDMLICADQAFCCWCVIGSVPNRGRSTLSLSPAATNKMASLHLQKALVVGSTHYIEGSAHHGNRQCVRPDGTPMGGG